MNSFIKTTLLLFLYLIAGFIQAGETAGATQTKKGSSKFSAEDRAIMQRSASSLAEKMPAPGLRVGEKAPDFTLPNAFGMPVSLYKELKKGPVVLVFYRGAWCPFCNLHLHELKKAQPEFVRYAAQLITITPQKPDRSAQQIRKDDYSFEVLSDLDSKVMKAFRLYYELDPELNEVYLKHGLDIAAYNGPGRTVLPVPGSFVIDKSGIVRAMHADTDYKQRMATSEIIKALKDL
ncbi:peroxiredoxin-like family protein [Sulfuriflexus mobilis]|uniref:peroxiredoxin-like family protein n=1 Tax=Sulfuriflexus mobilis TaxID=1811807 RepID=UPI000F820906|nr:peroxiredoxin-like family protein [Sulfuriflexus mobilis]